MTTGTLPNDCDLSDIEPIFRKHGFVLNPVDNKTVIPQLAKNESYLSFTDNGCDCDTGLGSIRILNVRYEHPQFKKMSDAEWKKLSQQVMPELEERNKNLYRDAKRWQGLIKELATGNKVRSIGLLIHFYREGGLDTETIKINDFVCNDFDEVDVDYLINMQEDVLYRFID